jgi:hypothetical protein
MQKRAFERITSNIDVSFFCFDTDYKGTIINISENGIFISTDKVSFPFDPEFDVIIPDKKNMLTVPVRVRRVTKSGDNFDGIGAIVLNPSKQYLDFVRNLKS